MSDRPTDVPFEERPVLSKGDEGDDVADLQELLNDTELKPRLDMDGDFGGKTEGAVAHYQASRGLEADGICGPATWQALYEGCPPLPPPPHALSNHEIEAICRIAEGSEIAGYSWADRGVAPIGYTQGMALAFAQTCRKLKAWHPAAVAMAKAVEWGNDKDALYVYRDEFAKLRMNNFKSGADTLRHLCAFAIGLGMRESSGRHCEGRDMSADNVQSDTCEAGAWQTSYNAHSASEPEFGDLMTEYSNPANKATCYLAVFDDGVNCSDSEWSCYGSGEGFMFQELCKSCPAFAWESAALTLRNLCNHYGPVLRAEVELKAEADEMLRAVQAYIDGVAEIEV